VPRHLGRSRPDRAEQRSRRQNRLPLHGSRTIR
jgi:hypothetical protein